MAKKNKAKIDSLFPIIIFSLLLLGFITLFSASASLSQKYFNNTYTFLKHQCLSGIIPGILLGLIFFKIDLRNIKKRSLYLFLGNLILSTLVFFPIIGVSVGGAKRWISLGSFSFQPSELFKITLPIYLSAWLSLKKKKNIRTLFYFFLILVPVIVILTLQPDMSTLVILIIEAVLIYFLSNTPITHTFLMTGASIAGLLGLINLKSYRMKRFLVFIDPKIDPMGMGYQIKQALIAIGSGGIYGKGLCLSQQKFGLLPNIMSDSIFALFCEETGFIGAFVLIFLFFLLLMSVKNISSNAKDDFSKTLSFALGAGITIQALLNIGAMTGVLPLTGVPLPFISYGGTHLVIELVSTGIILNISKQ